MQTLQGGVSHLYTSVTLENWLSSSRRTQPQHLRSDDEKWRHVHEFQEDWSRTLHVSFGSGLRTDGQEAGFLSLSFVARTRIGLVLVFNIDSLCPTPSLTSAGIWNKTSNIRTEWTRLYASASASVPSTSLCASAQPD
jgi:hypothetical protein